MNFDLNISPEELEQAERYLQGQMTAAEKQFFEREIAADTALQNKVQQVQLLMRGVQEAALTNALNRFHQQMPAPGGKTVRHRRLFPEKRWLAAASVVLIIALSCWFFLFRKTENEKLYATYFSPDPGLMTTMGTTDNYTFERAMVDYKTGKYVEAITAWKGLLQNAPQNDTLNYFIGAALLADDHAKECIPYLEKVTLRPRGYFHPDAWWYLGLALLKEGKKAQAVVAIKQSNHLQKDALLRALK